MDAGKNVTGLKAVSWRKYDIAYALCKAINAVCGLHVIAAQALFRQQAAHWQLCKECTHAQDAQTGVV